MTDNKIALGQEDIFQLIDKQWMLITAGNAESFNTMTASWGGFGILWHKKVAYLFVRPERYTYEFIEKNERLTLSFFDEEYRKVLQYCGTHSGRDGDKIAATGLTPIETERGCITFEQAKMTIECRKLFKSTMHEEDFIDKSILEKYYSNGQGNLHAIYVVEIENIHTT